MTLADVMPHEFTGGEYHDTPAYKLKDREVRTVHCLVRDGDNYKRWPGPHKNVVTWVILDNGKRVGWNENVVRGWSFPVLPAPLWPRD